MTKNPNANDDIMLRRFWGTTEIARYTKQPLSTVQYWGVRRDFPMPDVLMGTRTKGWDRTVIIKWWAARQKEKSHA